MNEIALKRDRRPEDYEDALEGAISSMRDDYDVPGDMDLIVELYHAFRSSVKPR